MAAVLLFLKIGDVSDVGKLRGPVTFLSYRQYLVREFHDHSLQIAGVLCCEKDLVISVCFDPFTDDADAFIDRRRMIAAREIGDRVIRSPQQYTQYLPAAQYRIGIFFHLFNKFRLKQIQTDLRNIALNFIVQHETVETLHIGGVGLVAVLLSFTDMKSLFSLEHPALRDESREKLNL